MKSLCGFTVWKLERELNQILYFHCIPTHKHTCWHTLLFFSSAVSSKLQMRFPHSRSAGPHLHSEPSDFKRGLKHYYHIITGVIRALFGRMLLWVGLGLFWKCILFQTEHLFTYNILFQVSPMLSPLSGGLLKPCVDASTADRMRCSGEQAGNQRKRNSRSETYLAIVAMQQPSEGMKIQNSRTEFRTEDS